MMVSFGNQSQPSKSKLERGWVGRSFQPENFIPGLVIGFIFGMLLDLSKPHRRSSSTRRLLSNSSKCNPDEDLKMVLVVRQDLKMGQGKVASQCAHAATGLYAKLMQSHQNLLRRWEHCGQAKIVVTCKNQQEMNKLLEAAEGIGLPTYVVADAGRTQVSAGSKTVLAIGPGGVQKQVSGWKIWVAHARLADTNAVQNKPGRRKKMEIRSEQAWFSMNRPVQPHKTETPQTGPGTDPVLTTLVLTGYKSVVDSVTGKQRLL